jgi:hypothetical protein
MTSLSLRLASLTNLRFQQIMDGVADADEDSAHYIFEQSIKFWRCGGEMALVPMRLLYQHLETAEERDEQAKKRGVYDLTIKKQIRNLEFLLDLLTEEIKHQLKHCPSRSEAALLSRIFCLGKEGLRIWDRARRRQPKVSVTKKPMYRSKARKAAAKRKQASTATPDNALPPPSPSNEDEDTSPVTRNENNYDESGENDPPAFTRDPSITRVKTRFAIIQSTPPLPAAAATTLDDFDDTITEANSTVRKGKTPPGEDEFAAAAAMVTCKGCGEESNTADDSTAAAAAADTSANELVKVEVYRHNTHGPCLVTDPTPEVQTRYQALQAVLAAEKSRDGEKKTVDENSPSCSFLLATAPEQKKKREKEEKQSRGIAQDIQQMKGCVSI